MRITLLKCGHFIFYSLFFCVGIFAQSRPLYQLPENPPEKNERTESPFLIGTDNGLFKVSTNGLVELLWNEGKVERIVKTSTKWFFVTEKGIISSTDLKVFSEKNKGLPCLTVKSYDGKKKVLQSKMPLLKDIFADPFDENILVTATKDAVYITYDGGENWKSIGSTSNSTGGVKAVAVSHMPVYNSDGTVKESELVAFMSHPIYGFSYCRLGAKNPSWIDVSAGFDVMPSMTQVDEIADILPVVCKAQDGSLYSEIYVSQTFIPNLYRFNWRTKRAEKIYAGTEHVDTIDGLCQSGSSLVFSTIGKVSSYSFAEKKIKDVEKFNTWKRDLYASHSVVNSAYVPAEIAGTETSLELSELYLLKPESILTPWGEKANKRKAVYASVYQLRNDRGIEKYRKITKDNKLNAVVFDMKDDYGLLRFEPKSPLLKQKGDVTAYKIDVDKVVSEFKKDDVYLIARIVVFKDKNLASYDKCQYAVWNSKTNSPWMGIRGVENEKDENGNVVKSKTVYYDENWVDPYSEEVWEYNVEIAKELVERGFDEIQFDYIRFPTDGTNMKSAQFRWKDKGMDKESALISFLAYARKNINAPIGIDIYGANGWYRSGTRTGQDVELMSEYVDVICPMFYPSHFEQNFLEYNPVIERPYRIYFFGSYRNTVIGRNRIVVRPWIQAFYMNVRFDRNFYDKNYVLREIFGVRDGLDRGYMHWNNSGRGYEDISPDPDDNEFSPWRSCESDLQKRLPAFSLGDDGEKPIVEQNRTKVLSGDEMISIWNSILEQDELDSYPVHAQGNLLHVDTFGNLR